MEIVCTVCEHGHEEDGSCACGCEVEQQLEQICWSCGHNTHIDKPCNCGCDG